MRPRARSRGRRTAPSSRRPSATSHRGAPRARLPPRRQLRSSASRRPRRRSSAARFADHSAVARRARSRAPRATDAWPRNRARCRPRGCDRVCRRRRASHQRGRFHAGAHRVDVLREGGSPPHAKGPASARPRSLACLAASASSLATGVPIHPACTAREGSCTVARTSEPSWPTTRAAIHAASAPASESSTPQRTRSKISSRTRIAWKLTRRGASPNRRRHGSRMRSRTDAGSPGGSLTQSEPFSRLPRRRRAPLRRRR